MSAAGAGGGRRITVRSVTCRGVKSFIPFQKPPLYVTVSLGDRREKTPADADGGENPDWDGAVFAFDLGGAGAEAGDGLLQFEVKAQVPLLSNKLVGTACVPVADLVGGDGAVPRHVSYQVCATDGKPNGTLSFAYAVTGGDGANQQQQLYPAPNGARPGKDPSFCCAPPPPPSSAAYPAPAMANFAPHSSSYPPLSNAAYPAPAMANFVPHSSNYPPPPSPSSPASAPLYPPLLDLLPPSSYPPPPPMMDSPFPAPNFAPNSSYPPPPALATAYPPPLESCTACSAPPAQYISSYPPPPPSIYPPPPPIGYPPPAPPMNPEFPASSFPLPTSSYPPLPGSGSEFPVLPRSTPSPAPSSADRALPYIAPPLQDLAITYPKLTVPPLPSGGSYYPPPGTRHAEEAARTPYYYPQPGSRYS